MPTPLLYEINTRCWLADLSGRAGRSLTLADIPQAEFNFFERAGFTHLWLMGVWKLGEYGRAWSRKCHAKTAACAADIAGSPYAIVSYNVSDSLGGDAALAAFRRELNRRGIKLLLDFIPNHVAVDHPWVRLHPESFVTSSARKKGTVKPYSGSALWFAHGHCGYGSPWVDTLQLDYRSPVLRRAMVEELRRIADKCDGVRCDMAMLVLNDVFEKTWKAFPRLGMPSREGITQEFWSDAIGSVHRFHPDFLFLAEVYWDLEARLQELGFQFTYDKRLYDFLVRSDGTGAARYLRGLSKSFTERSAHFLENHDEPRIASLLSLDEHRAAALLILGLPGMRFLHEGQLSGLHAHANVHFARRSSEEPDARITAFYRQLLEVLLKTVVGIGKPLLLSPIPAWDGNATWEQFALIQWQGNSGCFDLVVVNLSKQRGQCYAPVELVDASVERWHLRDLLGSECHERLGAELQTRGLYLDVPPHAAQLFQFSPSATAVESMPR